MQSSLHASYGSANHLAPFFLYCLPSSRGGRTDSLEAFCSLQENTTIIPCSLAHAANLATLSSHLLRAISFSSSRNRCARQGNVRVVRCKRMRARGVSKRKHESMLRTESSQERQIWLGADLGVKHVESGVTPCSTHGDETWRNKLPFSAVLQCV